MTPKEAKYIPLDTGWEEPSEDQPIIAQIEGVGKVFRRNVAHGSQMSYDIVNEDGHTVTMTHELIIYGDRVVRVIGFLNQTTGLVGFMSIDDNLPEGFHPSDFPHQEISAQSTIDNTTIERDLIGVLKNGASKSFFDLDKKWRNAGGDPNFRVPKSEQVGWRFI